ncbi:MAG TPA: LptF/LptG family permease [Rubricoccaceae bacterium]|nr:LptF/LptG family permease [Rubricoccaceae bacterium]
MTRFDLHVLRRFFAATALLLGLLVVFFVVLDYVEYIDDFMDRGATMGQVFGTYYRNYIPEIVKLTSPLAVFLAAIYVTARLSQTMQLTALTMAGVSLYRVLVPFAFAGALVAGFMLWFNGWVVPPANAVVLDFQQRYYRDAPEGPETSELYRQTAPGSVLAVGFYDPEQRRAFRVSLLDFAVDTAGGVAVPARLVRRLDAETMRWDDTTRTWRLTDAVVHRFSPDGRASRASLAAFDTALTVLPSDLARSERDAERLTIPEARAYVASLERAGASRVGRALVEYHAKFAYPLANLVLVLVGVPLAARRRRGGQAVQLGLGLLVAFVYLALQKVVEPFGYAEELSPVLAAWLPHAVFLAFAVVLLLRTPK